MSTIYKGQLSSQIRQHRETLLEGLPNTARLRHDLSYTLGDLERAMIRASKLGKLGGADLSLLVDDTIKEISRMYS